MAQKEGKPTPDAPIFIMDWVGRNSTFEQVRVELIGEPLDPDFPIDEEDFDAMPVRKISMKGRELESAAMFSKPTHRVLWAFDKALVKDFL